MWYKVSAVIFTIQIVWYCIIDFFGSYLEPKKWMNQYNQDRPPTAGTPDIIFSVNDLERYFLWESENIILTMFQAKEPLLERLNELKYRCFYYISSYQARFLINRTVSWSSRLRSSVEIIPSLMKYFCQTTPVLVRSDPFLSARGSQTLMRGPLTNWTYVWKIY